MREVIISNATTAQVAAAVAAVAHRHVVYCPSVADASSPVVLIRGPHTQQIGQAADWRHNVEAAADQRGALCVMGYWDVDGQRWVACVPAEFAAGVVDRLREFNATTEKAERQLAERRAERSRREEEQWEAERPAREARAAAFAAKVAARQAELRPLYEAALANCRRRTDGQIHGGDRQAVEYAWHAATASGYEYDLARGRKLLTGYAVGTMETAS